MKKLILLLSVFMLVLLGMAQQEIFVKGNQLYEEKKYKEAIETYLQAVNQGYESVEINYNLGNSYFKTNQIAQSILFYERAKKLQPNDENIIHNLGIANTRIVDKIEAIPELAIMQFWKNIVHLFSIDGWAIMGICTLIFGLVFFLLYFFSKLILLKKTSFYIGILVILISFISLFFAQKQYAEYTDQQFGIVFAETITVKSSPDDAGNDLFVIHEGIKVRIKDKIGDWYNIALPNGNEGWMKKNTVEII